MEKMFIYDNGELAEVQEKSFIFELAMEGYIVDNPVLLSNECLDLKDPEVKSVEEPLDSKHRIDVQIQYANDTTAVVELKNVPVDTKALQQLLDYLKAKRQKMAKENQEEAENIQLIGILVGSEFDEQVIKKIESNVLKPETVYAVELRRYCNNGNWYVFTKWYGAKAKRDYTKYQLDFYDKPLGKGRMVYEVIKHYISEHPQISYADLKKVFRDKLRKHKRSRQKYHLIALEADIAAEDRYSRYFKTPLPVKEGNIAVCSQWGIGNIEPFIEKVKELGYGLSIDETNK